MRIRESIAKTLQFPPKLTLVEWADKNRQLSRESSSEPGPWSTDRVEVARGPMLAVTDPRVHTITVMACTQLLKTELINNIVGYFVHLDPAPMIVMQPTEKLAHAWSKDRLDKMIRDTPVLSELFAEKRSRDSSNTISHKEFPGGHLTVVGANAPSDLASRPVRVVLCDETDKYPMSAGKEGDPIKLISERSTTFWNALKVHVCSPTIEGRSRIASEYEVSDKRIYEVPCPHCGKFEEMKWTQVKWDKDAPETAQYFCEHCGEAWSEIERLKVIQQGKWKATAPFNGHAGFKVNKLVSPWESLAQIAAKFQDAKRQPEKLKVFINTQLAETWKERGEAPEWERLYERRENYTVGVVPKGVIFLTAGVDVQEKRLEVEVVGWGKDKQSWSIQTYVFDGSTDAEDDSKNSQEARDVWKKLDGLMSETWHSAEGVPYQLQVMAVDSGFRTQTVYNWCRRYPMNRVIAVKGSERLHILMNSGSIVDVKKGRHRMARAFKVFTLGVGLIKSELYGWLKLPVPIGDETPPPGYCHFPEYEPEFFKQLTAESLMKKVVNGQTVFNWEKSRDRNEALDCRVYARAAASYFGMDRFRDEHWAQLTAHHPQTEVKSSGTVPERSVIKRRPSQFL